MKIDGLEDREADAVGGLLLADRRNSNETLG